MSQNDLEIDYQTTVDEIMRRWPATIRIFLDFRMLCVGCPIAPFHTVTDACREYHIELGAFLAALREAAAGKHTNSTLGADALGNSKQPVRVA